MVFSKDRVLQDLVVEGLKISEFLRTALSEDRVQLRFVEQIWQFLLVFPLNRVLRQSSPPVSERASWVDGDDVWVRIDTAQGPRWKKLSDQRRCYPPCAVGKSTDGSKDCWLVLLARHESQLRSRCRSHFTDGSMDYLKAQISWGATWGCDWFLLVALRQGRFWRVRSSFCCAVEEFVESDIG